jgi:hypothetical protein
MKKVAKSIFAYAKALGTENVLEAAAR